ncbi:radical SAM/SPASM domain-containing protein [Desulfocurvus sp. DL9XJH121]
MVPRASKFFWEKTVDQVCHEYFYIRHLYEIRNRQPFVNAPMHELFIESTNVCNLKCLHCIQRKKTRRPTEIELDIVEKILDDVMFYKPFTTFQGQGEPMMDQRLPQLYRMCTERGIPSMLVTNGTLMTEERAVSLLESGLQFVVWSIPGGTQEVYEKIQVGAKYPVLLENLVRFLRIQREMGKEHVRVRTLYVDTGHEKDRARYQELFNRLPIDKVTVQKYFNYYGDDEWSHMSGQGTLDNTKEPGLSLVRNCKKPWSFCTVRSEGNISACITDYDAKCVVGDLHDQRIFDIWNGERYQAMRKAVLAGDFESVPGMKETCARCGNPEGFHPLHNQSWQQLFGDQVKAMFDRGHVEAWLSNPEELASKWKYLEEHGDEWIEEVLSYQPDSSSE